MDPRDPYTAAAQLCDNDGTVRSGAMHHGTNYPCTGHAHFGGEHIRCTSPAHTPKVAWVKDTGQRVCGNCGHPVDAPLPFTVAATTTAANPLPVQTYVINTTSALPAGISQASGGLPWTVNPS